MKTKVVSSMLLGLVCGVPFQTAVAMYSGWPPTGGASDGWRVADVDPTFTFAYVFSVVRSSHRWSPSPAALLWYDTPLMTDPDMPERLSENRFDTDLDAAFVAALFGSAGEPVRGLHETDGWPDEGGFHTFSDGESPVVDPMLVIHDRSELDPILAPDSTVMMIPAPGAVLLGGLGVVLMGRLRRRRSL